MSKQIKYTIELEIVVIEGSIDESDINALTKGCKYVDFINQLFKIKDYNREVV